MTRSPTQLEVGTRSIVIKRIWHVMLAAAPAGPRSSSAKFKVTPGRMLQLHAARFPPASPGPHFPAAAGPNAHGPGRQGRCGADGTGRPDAARRSWRPARAPRAFFLPVGQRPGSLGAGAANALARGGCDSGRPPLLAREGQLVGSGVY